MICIYFCVLPILILKIFYFYHRKGNNRNLSKKVKTRTGEHKKEGKKQGWVHRAVQVIVTPFQIKVALLSLSSPSLWTVTVTLPAGLLVPRFLFHQGLGPSLGDPPAVWGSSCWARRPLPLTQVKFRGGGKEAGWRNDIFPMITHNFSGWEGCMLTFCCFVVSGLGKGSKLVDCQYTPSLAAF